VSVSQKPDRYQEAKTPNFALHRPARSRCSLAAGERRRYPYGQSPWRWKMPC
jgi:hypothetical protein